MLSLQLRCSANMSYFCTLEIVDKQRFFSFFFFFLKTQINIEKAIILLFELQKILENLS